MTGRGRTHHDLPRHHQFMHGDRLKMEHVLDAAVFRVLHLGFHISLARHIALVHGPQQFHHAEHRWIDPAPLRRCRFDSHERIPQPPPGAATASAVAGAAAARSPLLVTGAKDQCQRQRQQLLHLHHCCPFKIRRRARRWPAGEGLFSSLRWQAVAATAMASSIAIFVTVIFMPAW